LVSRVEAAYFNAYWNGAQKRKKSLENVVNHIYKKVARKHKKPMPLDFKEVDKEFAEMEGLRNYGWIKN
jgi:hypothetical protein